MDFTFLPILTNDENVCKVLVFRGGFPREGQYMKTTYYKTPKIYELYDTNEEIMMDEEGGKLGKPIFQESADSKMHTFKTWEEADKFAEVYWANLMQTKKFKLEEIF
jgi:hypothetical protein